MSVECKPHCCPLKLEELALKLAGTWTSNPLPLRGDHQWEACAWQLGCCFSHVVHALQWKSVRPANSFSTEAKLTWLEDAVIHC